MLNSSHSCLTKTPTWPRGADPSARGGVETVFWEPLGSFQEGNVTEYQSFVVAPVPGSLEMGGGGKAFVGAPGCDRGPYNWKQSPGLVFNSILFQVLSISTGLCYICLRAIYKGRSLTIYAFVYINTYSLSLSLQLCAFLSCTHLSHYTTI